MEDDARDAQESFGSGSDGLSYRTKAYLAQSQIQEHNRSIQAQSSFQLDPEYAAHLEKLAPKLGTPSKAKIGDVQARRETIGKFWPILLSQFPDYPDVEKTHVANIPSYDGYEVPLYRFSKISTSVDQQPSSAIIYCHGGGFITSSVEAYAPIISKYVSLSGIPIFAPDYRLSPEHPFPAPLEDCYAALQYIHSNASSLHIDPSRIGIMGDSAGGGLCAGTTILARNRGLSPALKKHMIIAGNLDDRNVAPNTFPELTQFTPWTIDDNITGWDAYLASGHEFKQNVSAPAAPARLVNVSGMPNLYLEVPCLDILRDEGIEYAKKFMQQGIEVEMHVWPGVPHSFEAFAPECEVARTAIECRVKAMMRL